jgi:alpha-D-xyloside xylohydrolase
MHWNDKSQTLTINARKGKYKGMIGKRNFIIILSDGQQKTVNYSGKSVKQMF